MLTAFDVGVGILVLISAILATARGLTREVLSLATWAGSAAIAIYMLLYHPEFAQQYIAEELVANIATVAVTFIVALIVLHLITMRIADFVVDSKIGPLDRTLGFLFGVARGVLIAVVLVVFGQWLLGPNLPPWAAESRSLPPLADLGDSLIAALPPDLEDQVTDVLRRGVGGEDPNAPDSPPPEDIGTDALEDGTPPAAPVAETQT
ncbi:MAG TPA: CvpA family protein [Devosiaceae bacterium]|jgi:membrane protein required for colicin V production|nr:CvpA family protein [Devosiaceae bacterium]